MPENMLEEFCRKLIEYKNDRGEKTLYRIAQDNVLVELMMKVDKQYSGLGGLLYKEIFPVNIINTPPTPEQIPNAADLEMEEFRKQFQSIDVTGYNGYMVYRTKHPMTSVRAAEKIISEHGLQLKATANYLIGLLEIRYIP